MAPPVALLTALCSLCLCRAVRSEPLPSGVAQKYLTTPETKPVVTTRETSRFLTDQSARFAINGRAFPHLPFDIGESYGGLLPISADQNDTQQLYFWFFPSDNPSVGKEITIWLNGGPGCSSLIGLLAENGKFLWQPGQFEPVLNDWAWTKLTNVVWIDQPVSAGFAQGTPTASSTEELAPQFMGFLKNFFDTFDMAGSKIYLAGESYAGQYIPYFASAMVDANDTDYFNVQGTMLIDPAISSDVDLVELPMLNYAEANQQILRFNESFRSYIRDLHANEFNYTGFFEEHLKFPSIGPMPTPPNADEGNSPFRSILAAAATLINPCFNVYHILDYCPRPTDPLGLNGPLPDSGPFWDLPEVKAAVNAPNVLWSPCAPKSVFASPSGQDQSPRPSMTVLPRMFERVPLNIVANGALDFLIPSLGTLFALQNVTWAGTTGFEERPSRKFVVPVGGADGSSSEQQQKVLGAAGEMGTWGWERGVLYADVEGAGHMLPQHNPSAAFRLLEVLLGRVGVEEGMGGGAAWTV
ncbi:unnamed protein product [Discula destructiva]